MALLGMGIMGTLMFERYGVPIVRKTKKAMDKKMKNMSKQILDAM